MSTSEFDLEKINDLETFNPVDYLKSADAVAAYHEDLNKLGKRTADAIASFETRVSGKGNNEKLTSLQKRALEEAAQMCIAHHRGTLAAILRGILVGR